MIAVIGIDALGGKLEEENVFRSEVAANLLNVPLGAVISPELIAKLVTLPEGIPKGSPASARIIPFINKVDIKDGLENGRRVAREILALGHQQIPYVILGQARYCNPVVEMISFAPDRRSMGANVTYQPYRYEGRLN